MTAPAVTVNLSATVISVGGPYSIGDVLVPVAGAYVKATTANRALAAQRSHGVALTAWGGAPTDPPGTVQLQHVGIVDAAVTGLGAGAASWVRVSTTGRLERAAVSGADDVAGYCAADGTLFALFGLFTATIANGGGGTVPTGTGVVSTTAGAFNAAASAVVSIDEAAQELDIVVSANSTLERLTNYAGASVNGANIVVQKARGTSGSPTKALSGDQLGGIAARGRFEDAGGGFGSSTSAGLRFVALEDFTSTTQGAGLAVFVTATGTSTGKEGFRFTPGTFAFYNPAATFKYSINAAALAADRTLNLPLLTGTDTVAVLALAQTLTNKTIDCASNTVSNVVNATVSAAAAIAVSKLAPSGTNGWVLTTTAGVPVWAAATGGGASAGGAGQVQTSDGAGAFTAPTDVLAGAGFVSIGPTPATVGNLRMPSTVTVIASRNAANSADLTSMSTDASDNLFIGNDPASGTGHGQVFIDPTSFGFLSAGGTTAVLWSNASVNYAIPIYGYGSPYGVHGQVNVPMANANYNTVTSGLSEYTYMFLDCTSTPNLTANRTLTLPLPASDALGYAKYIRNSQAGAFSIQVGNGSLGGITAVITVGKGGWVWANNTAGVRLISALI